MDLALSEAERAVAKMLKAKYKMKCPFAAHIAKDAVCVLEIERIKAELSTSETVIRCAWHGTELHAAGESQRHAG